MARIVTPIFRTSFVNLVDPKEDQNGNWLWSIVMIFEPDTDLSELRQAITDAAMEHWKGNPPKTGYRNPIRPGEWRSDNNPRGFDLDKYPEYDGKLIVTANSYTKRKADGTFDRTNQPGIVGPNPQDHFIADGQSIYSGMYARALVSPYVPKNPKAPPGVSLGLHHVQKCYDGEPLGISNGRAESHFGAIVPPEGVGYNGDLLADLGV